MNSWIDEKLTRLRAQAEKIRTTHMSLQEKLENLKKQQALEIEITANKPKVNSINHQLTEFKKQIGVSKEVIDRGYLMLSKWDELLRVAKELNQALEEARELFDFTQTADKILAWIHERQIILGANEMGRDLEHCQLLVDKLIGKHADHSVDDSTVKDVNRLGNKLISQGSDSKQEIQAKLKELNEAWSLLQGKMERYKSLLEAALEVHRFNRDVDDTNTRIMEKASLLASDDFGRDFNSVEALLRKQDTTERDMSAIHKKLNVHDNDAKILLAKDPPLRESIIESLKKLEVSWQELAQLAHARRTKLQQSYNLHKYFDAVKKAETWANGMRTKMTSYMRPTSVEDAKSLIASHNEKLVEIEGRQEELKTLSEYGQKIAAEQPEHKAEIQRAHRRLQNIEHQIRQTWEHENISLEKALRLQTLYAQILQVYIFEGILQLNMMTKKFEKNSFSNLSKK